MIEVLNVVMKTSLIYLCWLTILRFYLGLRRLIITVLVTKLLVQSLRQSQFHSSDYREEVYKSCDLISEGFNAIIKTRPCCPCSSKNIFTNCSAQNKLIHLVEYWHYLMAGAQLMVSYRKAFICNFSTDGLAQDVLPIIAALKSLYNVCMVNCA